MNFAEEHLKTIESIYSAVTAPTQWQTILDKLSVQIGCIGASLIVTDHTIDELSTVKVSRLLAPHFESYFANGHDKPELKFILSMPKIFKERSLHSISDALQEMNESLNLQLDLSGVEAWSRELFGVHHRYTSPLGFHPAYYDIITFQFGQIPKPMMTDHINMGNAFLPHIAKAVELSRPFTLLQTRFNAIFDVLDRFHLAVFILTDKDEIALKNNTALRLLSNADGLCLKSKNRLGASIGSEDVKLRTAIREIQKPQLQSGANSQRITVSRTNKLPLLLELSPLRSKDIDISGLFQGILVIATDPEHRAIVDTSGMAPLFTLTEAEQHICKLIVDGFSTNDMADTRNSSPETIRNQVKSVLQKTSTNSRSELVRLALSINLPVDKQDSDQGKQ